MKYLRFVIARNDAESNRRQGLFQAMRALKDKDALVSHELELYEAIYEWFCTNLRKPRRLAASSRPHAKAKALSWFKDSATEHVRRMREIAEILDRHGIHTEIIQTDKPGYIVYEDKFQVAAEPFSDSGA